MWRVGDGRDIKIQEDRWLVDECDMGVILILDDWVKMVSDLIVVGDWFYELLEEVFNERDWNLILVILVSVIKI